MTAKLLLAEFDRLSEAPGAVAKLRRFAVDLAVRGMLVHRAPDDELVAGLLERIEARVLNNLRSGTFREPVSRVEVPRHTLPFCPPAHWGWVSLVHIVRPQYGFAFASAKFNSGKRGMPLIRIRDISHVDTEAYFDGDFDEAYLVVAGDYLVGMDGDFNLRRWNGPDALLNQRVLRLSGWDAEVEPEFIRLPLQVILNHLHGRTSQTTVKHLSAKQVSGIEVPLPPLAEQCRIVERFDELMALCDQLEATRKTRERTRERLTTASLSRLETADPATSRAGVRFTLATMPALTRRSDQIKTLRRTLLNLAVRGQLVTQNTRDEPASIVIRKLRDARAKLEDSGTIKRLKPPLPVVLEPFPLPKSWSWARLCQVCDVVDPNPSHRMPVYVARGGLPFISSENFTIGDAVDFGIGKRVDEKTVQDQIDRFSILPGALGFSRIGTIGKSRPLPLERSYAISHAVCVINPLDTKHLSMQYLRFAMSVEGVLAHAHGGARSIGVPDLGMAVIRSMAIPIPPTAEQHRIVSTVGELMSLCDGLEAKISETDNARGSLLEALLVDALETSSGLAA